MSQHKRTLSGTTEISIDIVDIPSTVNAVRINGYKGSIGQILKKNDTTNKIEWGAESSITGTPPIAVSGDGVVSLNTDMGSKSLTTTGTITAEQLTSTDDITIAGDINANGHILGDLSTNITRINGITLGGILNANGTIVGDGATTISGMADIAGTSATISGNINANGNIVGDGATEITNVDSIVCNVVETIGNVICNGNISGDNATNISLMNNISAVSATISGDITANGNIVGDDATNISAIDDIAAASATFSGNITANGNIVGDDSTDITGINNLTAAGTITANGNIFGDGATNIAFINSVLCASLTSTANSYFNGNIVGDNATDITGINNLTCAGTSTLNGTVYIGDNNADISSIKGTTSFQLDTASGSWGEQRILKDYRAYATPYDLKTYSINAAGTSADLNLTGDTNSQLYRSIKIKATDFISTLGSTNNLRVFDNNDWTSTNTASGGVVPNAVPMGAIEGFAYVDIPEGFKFRAIYISIRNSGTPANGYDRAINVYKKNIGSNSYKGDYNRKIVDYGVSPNYTANAYAYTTLTSPTEQDLSCRYDEIMLVNVVFAGTADAIMGGYILCEPVGSLDWSVKISTGPTFNSAYTLTINGVSHTFTNKLQNHTFSGIPYNADFVLMTCSDTGSRTYASATYVNGVSVLVPSWNGVIEQKIFWTHSQYGEITINQS
tara:strand:- start:2570 stop:4600 length:2031 start_codon:yes stop_codon:yes gene_type:complete